MKKPNHDPNNRGENWPGFLKSMQDPQLMAILNDAPGARLNRKTARANGYQNTQEAMDEAIKKGQERALEEDNIRKGRNMKMGEFYAEVFAALLPKFAYNMMVKGHKWIAPLFGYAWGNTPGNHMEESKDSKVPKLFPCNTCWVARKRFIWFGKLITQTYKKPDAEGVLRDNPTATKFIWEAK